MPYGNLAYLFSANDIAASVLSCMIRPITLIEHAQHKRLSGNESAIICIIIIADLARICAIPCILELGGLLMTFIMGR